MTNFTIDFFELAFLAEACIPPRPIARTMFWKNLTDRYWNEMTENERVRLFEWMNKNDAYHESLNTQHDTQFFHARFDPNNQYEVIGIENGEEKRIRAFLFEDKFWVNSRTFVDPDKIISAEKRYYYKDEIVITS